MFWCFVGIEAFTHMGEEFKNPERDFPLALLFGVLLAGLVYWACSVAVLSFHAYGDVQHRRRLAAAPARPAAGRESPLVGRHASVTWPASPQ